MKRFTLPFLILAASSGCITVESDPNDYGAPRRTSAPPPWMTNGQSSWRGTDGKPMQTSYRDTNPRSSTASTSNSSSATKSAAISSTDTTTTAKTSATSPPNNSKNDEELIKATYTVAKTKPEDEKTSTDDAPTKAAKQSADAKPRTAEAKSPSVNLGLLRLLNSKRITFHYEVKGPDSADAAGLELWGTTDLRNWKKYDTVARAPSSLVVEVKDEGLYGFTMVSRGKGELAKNQPPQAGEVPQVWVAVDQTKPVVQLLGAELNVLARTPTLVLRWTAKDRNLGPRPITLLYAERREGPWTPLAANVENSGHHEWILPAWVPPSIYVRIQATDLMGNLGMAQTTMLHIPGRPTAALREPSQVEPSHLSAVPSSPALEKIRPVTTTVPKPAVSILSVDNE